MFCFARHPWFVSASESQHPTTTRPQCYPCIVGSTCLCARDPESVRQDLRATLCAYAIQIFETAPCAWDPDEMVRRSKLVFDGFPAHVIQICLRATFGSLHVSIPQTQQVLEQCGMLASVMV